MATTLRRIQRLEADFRRYHRELDQQELRKKYESSVRISRKSLEYCEKQMDEVQSSWITGRRSWRSMRTRV